MQSLLWYAGGLGLLAALVAGLVRLLSTSSAPAPSVSWVLYAVGTGLGAVPLLFLWIRPPVFYASLGLLLFVLGVSLAWVGSPYAKRSYWRWVLAALLGSATLIVLFYLGFTVARCVQLPRHVLSGPLTFVFSGYLAASYLLLMGPGVVSFPPWTARLYMMGAVAFAFFVLWTLSIFLVAAILLSEPGLAESTLGILALNAKLSGIAYLGFLLLLAITYVTETVCAG